MDQTWDTYPRIAQTVRATCELVGRLNPGASWALARIVEPESHLQIELNRNRNTVEFARGESPLPRGCDSLCIQSAAVI